MIDISSARVNRLIVHKIGNKIRDEGYILSSNEAGRTQSLDDLILINYLSPVIQRGDIYDLHHESDMLLNTIYHFSNLIFEDQDKFCDHTSSIAKHLYSASTHPNIEGGEFIVILFDDIRTKSGKEQGLGLFRIEGKSDYLDIEERNGSLGIVECMGISLDKIQKGAVVLSGDKKVYVIDSLGQKTKYWLELFLKAVPSETPVSCARAAGAFIKAISKKIESPAEALKLGLSIQESLSNSDTLSIGDIKNISKSYLEEDEIDGILSGIRGKVGLNISDNLEIDSRNLTKYTRDVVKKTKITDGINIVISNKGARVTSVDVEKITSGLKATINIQLLED